MSATKPPLVIVPSEVVTAEMTIYERMSAIMGDVGAVKKTGYNTLQKFNFRGVDDVVNAVSPILRKYGVVVIPTMLEESHEQVATGANKTMMGWTRLTVKYTFYAPDGTSIETVVGSESFDTGDKGTAKAWSVAYRTMFLQVFCLPTDEIDPDIAIAERSSEQATESKPFITDVAFKAILEAMTFAPTVDVLTNVANQLTKYDLTDQKHQEAVALFAKQRKSLEQNQDSEGKTSDIKADVKEASEWGTLTEEGFRQLANYFVNADTLEVLADGIEQAKKYDMTDDERVQLLAIHSARKKVLAKDAGGK